MRVRLDVPDRFDFSRTVLSHGWPLLSPFRLADDVSWIETVVDLPDEPYAVPIALHRDDDGSVVLRSPGRPRAACRRRLVAVAHRILNLDLDLEPFWTAVRRSSRQAWIAREGVGRLLRAPTAWEDLVKFVLTTNCSWSLTTRMCETLVERWGRPSVDGRRSFPTATTLARVGEGELRAIGKTGYRAPYIAALARAVADGSIDLLRWEHADRPAVEVREELLRLPGVGPYVAENLLKLMGRPAGLALDSWMRAKYSRTRHRGRRIDDRVIARRYARLGNWAGLALWFDLTRDWHAGQHPSTSWENFD